MTTAIDDLLTTWAAAELSGDGDALDGLLTDDFLGIGPVGFMLPKQAWLSRFSQGLHYDSVELDDVSVRTYNDAALVVATQRAVGTHQGNPTPPTTRVSMTVVRDGDADRWRIAGMQYSFVAGEPGSPI